MDEQTVASIKEQVFGNGSQPSTQPQPETQPNNIVPAQTEQPVSTQPTTVETPSTPLAPEAVATPAPFVDMASYLQEKTGYKSEEELLQVIADYKLIKERPQLPVLEDEESSRLLQAIVAGKKEEVFSILDTQRKIEKLISSDINKDVASEIVKLNIQTKYADFTPSDVEVEFNRMFGIPKEPVQKSNEDDDEFNERHAEWQEKVSNVEKLLLIEAKKARPELVKLKSELKIPVITDEGYKKYQEASQLAQKEELELQAFIQSQKEIFSAMKPEDIVITSKFNDEASKLTFENTYIPNQEGFKKAMELAADPNKFFAKYTSPDGSPMNKELATDMYILENWQSILAENSKQAANETKKWFLANQKNIDLTQRNFVSAPVGDIEKLKQQVFGN